MAKQPAPVQQQSASKALMAAAMAGYLLLYPVLIAAAFYFLPTATKEDLTGLLGAAWNGLHSWVTTVESPTFRAFILVLLWITLLLGAGSLLCLEYWRFRRTPSFELPYVGKALQIPPVKNLFYDERVQRTPEKVKELADRVRGLEKEVAGANRKVEALSKDKMLMRRQLEELLQASKAVQEESDLYVAGLQEMYNLLSHILALASCKDSSTYKQEFRRFMDEVSNTLIRITVDKGNDKFSSIMLVNPATGVMEIVGSNGLSRESRSRTFAFGQGFAGWIWANKQPDVIADVRKDHRFQQAGCQPTGNYRSIVGVPIFGQEQEVIGALFVQSRRADIFDRTRDLGMLSYFAKLLALCMTDLARREADPLLSEV